MKQNLTMSIYLIGIILITIGMPENIELISQNLSLILAVLGILLIGFYELIRKNKGLKKENKLLKRFKDDK